MTKILARSSLSAADHSAVLRAKRTVAAIGTRIILWVRKAGLLLFLCAVVIVASLILGGGTRPGYISDAILQLLAVPLLLLSLWTLVETPLTKQMRQALWFCFAIALLPLIQLIPLPPWLWTVLPGRQPAVETFDILGRTLPWMPTSVSPQLTWLTALSVIPPLAVFLSVLLLGYQERRLLSLVFLAVGAIGAFVGLLQVAGGPESPLRFFEITNPTEAVGFFANRNHFAALLYCLILLLVPWVVDATTNAVSREYRNKIEYDLTSMVVAGVGFLGLFLFFAAEAMARSRAGLGLTLLALFGAVGIGFCVQRPRSGFLANKVLLGAVVLTLVFALQFALFRIMERFTPDSIEDARITISSVTFQAAFANLPFGSGLGTFVPVYALFEKPEGLSDAFVNRAHNDALEFLLETGVLGLVMTGIFLIWLVRRSFEIWKNAPTDDAAELDLSLARSATLVAGLLLIHSLVDYPLRTTAMMIVMAFACGLMIEPPAGANSNAGFWRQASERPSRRSSRKPKQVDPQRPRLASPIGISTSDRPSSSTQKWGADVQWPEQWSSADEAPKASKPGDDDRK